MKKNNYHQPLLPEKTYHIFSRAVGSELLFRSSENYRFFLQKLILHTAPVCDVYCYALLPNHFHLLIKIKNEQTIIKHFEDIKRRYFLPETSLLSDFIMERFSNFLNSYTKSYNKVYKRTGALFIDYLKRNVADSDSTFTGFVWYIHKNAVHHRLSNKVGDWPFDSYYDILNNSSDFILKPELLTWFGGYKRFVEFHQQPIYEKPLFVDV